MTVLVAVVRRSSESGTPSPASRRSSARRSARCSPSSPSSRPSAAKSICSSPIAAQRMPDTAARAGRRPGAGAESPSVIVLGIDPGLANTGYGVVAQRDGRLVALDELYFGQNVRTAFAVGQARGVAMLAAGQRGVPCSSYTPQQVKGAVCGNGRVGKDQVARMVKVLLGLVEEPRPDHAADALAVAICHANGAPRSLALAQAGA